MVLFQYQCLVTTLRDSDSTSLGQGLGTSILIALPDESMVQKKFRAVLFLFLIYYCSGINY